MLFLFEILIDVIDEKLLKKKNRLIWLTENCNNQSELSRSRKEIEKISEEIKLIKSCRKTILELIEIINNC